MSWVDLAAILGLGAACGLWFVIQQWTGRGPGGGCGSCSCPPVERNACTRGPKDNEPAKS